MFGGRVVFKERDYKKLKANWFRKGCIAATALAVVVLCVTILYYIIKSGSNNYIDGVPDIAIHIIIGVFILCGVLVLFYQIITSFTNKMILSKEGIEIKRSLKRIYIPTGDVIRIDSVHERAIGMPTQNRSVYKIITNTKTIEINSHEFLGMWKAIPQWVRQYITK